MNNCTQAEETNYTDISASGSTTSGLFGLRGRIGRLGFALSFLPSWIFAVAAGVSFYDLMEKGNNGLAFGASLPLMLLAGYLGVAAGVKRCHDLNKTGNTYVLAAVPIFGVAFILYLLFAKGNTRANRFGPPPGKLVDAAGELTLPQRAEHPDIHNVKNVPSRMGATEQDTLTSILGFDEEAAYTRIAMEIETKNTDKGLWLKAMVQAGNGDERQQAIAYTMLRMHQLRQAFSVLPVEKISAADNAIIDDWSQETLATRAEISEEEKLQGDHLKSSKNSSFEWVVAVPIGLIGVILIALIVDNYTSSKPTGSESLVSSQSEATLENTASRIIVPGPEESSPGKSATSDFKYSSLMPAPPPFNFGTKWFSCSEELEKAFRPQCYSGESIENGNDYCSEMYQPKVSKLSSSETRYGTNYMLLVTVIKSPVTSSYRGVHSCEISRGGEVISLVKYK